MILEIPTYEKMKKVMFYDVLMKLCHQVTSLHCSGDDIQNTKYYLTVFKKFSTTIMNDDTLEAIHNKNVANKYKSTYNRELEMLLRDMEKKKPRAEMMQELIVKNKSLKYKYNHLVDTNLKIVPSMSKSTIIADDDDVFLYTTKHRRSAICIYELIIKYADRQKKRARANMPKLNLRTPSSHSSSEGYLQHN